MEDTIDNAPDFLGEILQAVLTQVNSRQNKEYLQKYVVRPILEIIFKEIRVYLVVVAFALLFVVAFHIYVLQKLQNL